MSSVSDCVEVQFATKSSISHHTSFTGLILNGTGFYVGIAIGFLAISILGIAAQKYVEYREVISLDLYIMLAR